MFHLFVQDGVIPKESIHYQYEYMIDAANSIVSGMHTSHQDYSIQLAIRLLLPLIYKQRTIAATISNILHHYMPSSIQCCRTVLSLCKDVIIHPPMKHSIASSKLQQQYQAIRMMLVDGYSNLITQTYRKYSHTGMNHEISNTMGMIFDGIGTPVVVVVSTTSEEDGTNSVPVIAAAFAPLRMISSVRVTSSLDDNIVAVVAVVVSTVASFVPISFCDGGTAVGGGGGDTGTTVD